MLYSRCGATALAVSVIAALAGAAHAQDATAFMTLGQTAAPPSGFVALCETSPEDCAVADASVQDLAAVRTWASRTRWQAVFQTAGVILPATPPGAIETPASVSPPKARATPTAVRTAKDRARKSAAARPGAKAKTVVLTPSEPVVAPVPQSPEASPAPTLRELEAVNRRINRAIRRATDQAIFGQGDVWVAPTGPRATGDCEDYVLAKRRALIAAGVEASRLSIALVRTRRGEAHAVLLVATSEGDYVLDNLSPWVLRWDRAPYEWQDRQSPDDPLTWVSVDMGSGPTA